MTTTATPAARSRPPLEMGDRLTRDEFHRRYESNPQIRLAELVEGVVHVPSPARFQSHAAPSSLIHTWLGVYAAATANVEAADEATVILDGENEVQPDAMLRKHEGGTSHVTPQDYVQGPPELIAEIAASSASYDLGPKMRAYRRNGVREYIVWQIFENRLDWFALEDGDYRPLVPDARGVIHSKVFPGLRLAVSALLARDLAGVLKEQQRPARRTSGR